MHTNLKTFHLELLMFCKPSNLKSFVFKTDFPDVSNTVADVRQNNGKSH